MARDRGIFRLTEQRSLFKPASRVVPLVGDKRQGLSTSDARNSIGLSEAMQLIAVNAAYSAVQAAK
jgi:hypothetical protein